MRRRLACLFAMVAVLALGLNAASAQGFGFGGGFGRGGGFGGGGFGGGGFGGGGFGGGGFGRGAGGFNRGDGGGFSRGGGRAGRAGAFGRGGDAGYGRGGGRMGRDGGFGRGGDGGYGGTRRGPSDTAGRPPRGTGSYPGREAGQGRPNGYPGQGRPGGHRPYPQPGPVVKHPYPKPVIVQVPPRGPGHRPIYPRPPIIVAVPPYEPPRGAPPPILPPPPQVAGPPPVAPPPTAPPRNLVGPPPGAPPPPRTAAPQVADDGPYLPKEVLVTTRAQASPAQLAALEQRLQLVPVSTSRIDLLGTDLRRYRIAGNADVPATVQALRGDPTVRAAQPNFLFETQEQPAAQSQPPAEPAPPQGEPLQAAPASLGTAPVDRGKIAYAPAPELERPAQYAVAAMRLTDAHKVSTGADVRIAIIDTGLDETHPEIAGKVVDRFDAVDGSFMAHPHGTAMAGVIVADKTMIGIAPKARLIAIRAFAGHARGARGNSNDIIRAVDFAVSHHAQIVNLSFAGPRDELLAEVLAAARERGVIEVAAAGNQGPNSKPLYPAAEPGVIAITATDAQNAPFAMANRGTYIAAAAPGVDILAPSPGGTMQLTSGTSVAAAEASGVIALLLQSHPQMGATGVRRVLSDTAVRLPPTGGESLSLIDALGVVQTVSR